MPSFVLFDNITTPDGFEEYVRPAFRRRTASSKPTPLLTRSGTTFSASTGFPAAQNLSNSTSTERVCACSETSAAISKTTEHVIIRFISDVRELYTERKKPLTAPIP